MKKLFGGRAEAARVPRESGTAAGGGPPASRGPAHAATVGGTKELIFRSRACLMLADTGVQAERCALDDRQKAALGRIYLNPEGHDKSYREAAGKSLDVLTPEQQEKYREYGHRQGW